MTSEDWENIGKNLGRLYFAGEATSKDWYGYMQGAYWTGDKKGNMIAENISSSESSRKPGNPKNEATPAKVSLVGILLLPLCLIIVWKKTIHQAGKRFVISRDSPGAALTD